MFMFPFFIKKRTTPSGSILYETHVFLAKGGTALLEAENPQAFCKENDLSFVKTLVDGGIAYLEISPETTDLSAFYTYHESDSVEVWRTFITVKDDAWNVNFALDTITLSGHPTSILVNKSLRLCNYT
jgi:hypothetical protein